MKMQTTIFSVFKVFCSYQISWAGDVSNASQNEENFVDARCGDDSSRFAMGEKIKDLNNFNG